MTIIEKARISAPKEKLALINERTILSENLVPFYSGLKSVNADAVQVKDLTNEVRVRTERIQTITRLLPEYDEYILRLIGTATSKTYPTAIVLRDLTPQERLLFPITLNSRTGFGKKFPSVTKIFVYSEEHISGSKQIPALPEIQDVYLKLLYNDNIIEPGDSIEGDSIQYDTNFGGNTVDFTDANDPVSPAVDVKIIYVKLEALYQDKDPFDLVKNQTMTTQAYNQALSVTVTDDAGLNVTIPKGQANYPYNGQLVLVFQQNQLVLQANDMNRKIYVRGNMS